MASYGFEGVGAGAPSSRAGTRGRPSTKARARALLALAVALTAGLVATVLMTRVLARRSGHVAQAVVTRKVAVAKQELPMAAAVTAEMVDFIEWPVASAPAGAFDSAAPLVGRVVRTGMEPGEPFLETRLAPKGAGDGLSAVIPEELRAMTVRVNEASGVAGFVHPGDRVDVIATMQPREDDHEIRSRVVLQNIRVVAVGAELTAQGAKPVQAPVVTLLVTPDESERLALASSHGELQLTLRAGAATKQVETPGVSPPDLYGTYDTAARAPSRARRSDDNGRPAVAAAPRRVEPAASQRGSSDDEVVEIIRGSRAEERRLHTNGDGK